MSDNSKGNYIRNTAQMDDVDRLGFLIGGGVAIEAQEATGQQQFAASDVLPARLQDDQAKFEALGFQFGAPVKNDPLFRFGSIPEGWSKVRTDHSMWTDIKDERGITRAAVFYKAAFYDRDAFLSLRNPAYEVMSKVLYLDDFDAALADVPWDVLTEDERQAVIERFRRFLIEHRDEEQNPAIIKIYQDKFPRAEKAIAHFESLS